MCCGKSRNTTVTPKFSCNLNTIAWLSLHGLKEHTINLYLPAVVVHTVGKLKLVQLEHPFHYLGFPLSSFPKINFHFNLAASLLLCLLLRARILISSSGNFWHQPFSVFGFCVPTVKSGTNWVFVVGELYRKILPLPPTWESNSNEEKCCLAASGRNCVHLTIYNLYKHKCIYVRKSGGGFI